MSQNILSPKDDGIAPIPAPAGSNDLRLVIGVCIFLALIVWVVFGQTRQFPFINYDDDNYVYENAAFIHGVTLRGAAIAFSWNATDNWVPLTTLSHMLDWQFYGRNAGGHHLTNVLCHAVTAMLLFLVLYKMTAPLDAPSPSPEPSPPGGRRRALWRSAFVAAVFAVHPLRVESVAWVSERKDVLCGVFFMLTLWAYLGYVRKPWSLFRYLVTLFFYALALMAKPVVVTLPFILLLLDYWPLKRIVLSKPLPEPLAGPTCRSATVAQQRDPTMLVQGSNARLIAEKVPFLLLSLASCLPTILAEKPGIVPTGVIPVSLRIENSLVSCAAYIWQLFYPAKLALLYPFPYRGLPVLEVAGALAFLVVVSWAVFHWRRKYPYLLTGWLWYLVMLVPVIGLVQVGEQTRADRHTYLSQIGLYILLTWLVADLSVRLPRRGLVLASLSTLILAALVYGARIQTSYWRNSETIWKYTLSCTSANPTAHLNLGYALEDEGRVDEAMVQYEQVLKMEPYFGKANRKLGDILRSRGQLDEALSQYQNALKSDHGHDAAVDCNDMGRVLLRKGQMDPATIAFREALKFDPTNAAARDSLGKIFLSEGRLEDAAAQYQAALIIHPGNLGFQSNLAQAIWMLTQSPEANGDKTLALAKKANQMAGGNNPPMLRSLAAAYARCGQFPAAIETGKHALELADGQPPSFTDKLKQEIALYQAGSALPMVNQTNGTKP